MAGHARAVSIIPITSLRVRIAGTRPAGRDRPKQRKATVTARLTMTPSAVSPFMALVRDGDGECWLSAGRGRMRIGVDLTTIETMCRMIRQRT